MWGKVCFYIHILFVGTLSCALRDNSAADAPKSDSPEGILIMQPGDATEIGDFSDPKTALYVRRKAEYDRLFKESSELAMTLIRDGLSYDEGQIHAKKTQIQELQDEWRRFTEEYPLIPEENADLKDQEPAVSLWVADSLCTGLLKERLTKMQYLKLCLASCANYKSILQREPDTPITRNAINHCQYLIDIITQKIGELCPDPYAPAARAFPKEIIIPLKGITRKKAQQRRASI